MTVGTLICIGDTEAARRGNSVGECHLWSGRDQVACESKSTSRLQPRTLQRVVVDLGLRNGGASPKAAAFDPHVVVLTHSDDDHIGGALPLFQELPDDAVLQEVWVPYEWGLLASSLVLASTSGGQSEELPEFGEDSIVAVATRHPAQELLPGALPTAQGEDELELLWLADFPEVVDRVRKDKGRRAGIEGQVAKAIEKYRRSDRDWPLAKRVGDEAEVAVEVVRKALAIAEILVAAAGRGARVRYFSVDAVKDHPPPWLTAGTPGVATIVNAIEVSVSIPRMRDPYRSMYLLASLTVQNRRALMPFLWDSGHGGQCRLSLSAWTWQNRGPDRRAGLSDFCVPWGVLITSDSSGESACVQDGWAQSLVPWTLVSAMTAPHHGSRVETHEAIWDARASHVDAARWKIPVVLAGGSGLKKVPTKKYLDIDRSLRGCTCCRHAHPSTDANRQALNARKIRSNGQLRRRVPPGRDVVVEVNGPDVTVVPLCLDLFD